MSSWYKLTLLHVWMCLLRLHVVLDAGAYQRFRGSILSALWFDVDKRLEVVGVGLFLLFSYLMNFRKKSEWSWIIKLIWKRWPASTIKHCSNTMRLDLLVAFLMNATFRGLLTVIVRWLQLFGEIFIWVEQSIPSIWAMLSDTCEQRWFLGILHLFFSFRWHSWTQWMQRRLLPRESRNGLQLSNWLFRFYCNKVLIWIHARTLH
jgi:hypothetical protein